MLKSWKWEFESCLTWNTSSKIVLKRSYLNYLCMFEAACLLTDCSLPSRRKCSVNKKGTVVWVQGWNSNDSPLQIYRVFLTHLCNVFFQEMETCTWTSQQNPTAIPCWMPLNRSCMSGLQDIMAVSVPSTDWASRKSSSFSTANPARQSF